MTEIEFFHLLWKKFPTPLCFFILCPAPSQKMRARVSRNSPITGEGFQFLTNAALALVSEVFFQIM